MWKNRVGSERPQMTIWGMRIACWIRKATDTHSEYVMCFASWRQQWLHHAKQRRVVHTLPVFLHLALKCQTCCGFECSNVRGSCTYSVAALNATCSRIWTDEVMFHPVAPVFATLRHVTLVTFTFTKSELKLRFEAWRMWWICLQA